MIKQLFFLLDFASVLLLCDLLREWIRPKYRRTPSDSLLVKARPSLKLRARMKNIICYEKEKMQATD